MASKAWSFWPRFSGSGFTTAGDPGRAGSCGSTTGCRPRSDGPAWPGWTWSRFSGTYHRSPAGRCADTSPTGSCAGGIRCAPGRCACADLRSADVAGDAGGSSSSASSRAASSSSASPTCGSQYRPGKCTASHATGYICPGTASFGRVCTACGANAEVPSDAGSTTCGCSRR